MSSKNNKNNNHDNSHNNNNSHSSSNHRSPWISVVAIVLAVLMIGSVLFGALGSLVSAANSSSLKNSIDDLKNQAGDISDKSDKLEQDIASNESETQNLVEEKTEIDLQMDLNRQKVENLTEQIRQYNLLIAQTQEQLDQSQQKELEMNEQYKLRLRTMEEASEVTYWSILFEANNFSDLLDKINMINEVARADELMMNQLDEVTQSIALAKADVQVNKEEQEVVVDELAIIEEQLVAQRAQADALIVKLNEHTAQLRETYKQYDEEEASIRAQILKAQSDYEDALAREKKAAEQSNNTQTPSSSQTPSPSSGFVFPLPAGSASVSSPYGYRTHPIYGYYSLHSGVDLTAPGGTPIYAVASGTVTFADYSSVNGYYVSIAHGNGFGSMYAHMTNYIVASGDYVTQGQTIGYVGSTGWSTGAHLHMELLSGGATVNPMDYISF